MLPSAMPCDSIMFCGSTFSDGELLLIGGGWPAVSPDEVGGSAAACGEVPLNTRDDVFCGPEEEEVAVSCSGSGNRKGVG